MPMTVLNGTWGEIRSNSGAGTYAPDRECVWVAEFSSRATFAFRLLALDTEYVYDTLTVLQGDRTQDPLPGEAHYQFSGSVIPPSTHEHGYWSVKGPRVTLVWSSDSLIQRAGFQLAYSIGTCDKGCSGNGVCWAQQCVCDGGWSGSDCSLRTCAAGCGSGSCDEPSQTCLCPVGAYGSSCNQDFCQPYQAWKADQGAFSDHVGPGLYLPNTRCQWYIEPQTPGDAMRLDIRAFDLELEYDSLTIYDGPPARGGRLIASYTGSFPVSPPPFVVSVTSHLFLDFSTNQALQRVGFDASFTVLHCADSCSGNGVCLHHNSCFCFPGWRGHACEEPFCEADCSGHGTCVNGTTCACDADYDGTLCNVCIIAQGDCPLQCSGLALFSEASGAISDGAGAYVGGMGCQFLVAPEGVSFDSIVIEFTYFDLSLDGLARIVVTSPELDGVIIGEYSGTPSNSLPPPIIAKGVASVLVTFSTQPGSSPHNGFVASYSVISCPNSCSHRGGCTPSGCICEAGFSGDDCSKSICLNGCNGHGSCSPQGDECICETGWYGTGCTTTHCIGTTYLSGSSGTLFDHNPRLAQSYAPYSNCTFVVTTGAAPGGYIFLSRFQLEEGADFLGLVDTLPTHRLNFRSSGFLLPYPMFFSSDGFVVTFSSDGETELSGFELQWNSLTNCPGGCNGFGYCLPNNECSCFGGHFGKACEGFPLTAHNLLVNSSIASDTILQHQWKYYHFDVFSVARELEITTLDTVYVHSHTSGSEYQLPVLYIRYNAFPTLDLWDQRDTLNQFTNDQLIQLKTPRAGRWFIGMYGYQTQTYSLALSNVKLPIGGATSSAAGFPVAFAILFLVIGAIALVLMVVVLITIWLFRRKALAPPPASKNYAPQVDDADVEMFE